MAKRATKQSESLAFDPELAELPPDARWREWMNRIEVVIFASPQPVERDALARIVGRDASIDLLIDDIRESLRGKPYEVVNVAGGWALRTKVSYHDSIQASAAVPERGISFTQTEQMVLVSIAYHQPITRAGIGEILGRGVSRDVIGQLRDKDMITAGPRSPAPGAPFTYVTTREFLNHFNLDTLRDLPGLDELEEAGLLDRPSAGAEMPVPGQWGEGELDD